MNPNVFKGDSAREFIARSTSQRSGEALEVTYSGPRLGTLLLQIAGVGFFFLFVVEILL